MRSRICPLGSFDAYRYVVVLSRYQGKILLSRDRARSTWETQGGHVEPGETPLEAARRELFEESGALEYSMIPLCDYRAWDEETGNGANGVVFAADIIRHGDIPQGSEMAEVRAFDALPPNVTYPAITPMLFDYLWQQGELDYSSVIGRRVHVVIDRPLGSVHPVHRDMVYPVNYGYVPSFFAPDGEEQDAYVLGIDMPVSSFDGEICAVVHRKNDIEDKWVVCPEGMQLSREDVLRQIAFTEQYFDSELEMGT
ncbi:MAG: NUDIX domain-containing protein [Clostridia bacterium]|nr:NUDIX domain-containing protein [Clostridia bacterium]